MTQNADEKSKARASTEPPTEASPRPTTVGMVQNTRPSTRPGVATVGFGSTMPGMLDRMMASSATPSPSGPAPADTNERTPFPAPPFTSLPAALTPPPALAATVSTRRSLESLADVSRDQHGPRPDDSDLTLSGAATLAREPLAREPLAPADVSLADTQMGGMGGADTAPLLASAETMAEPSGASPRALDFGPLSRHSTVLPHVEHGGAEPRLIVRARDRYERVKTLGEGGVGEVLLARDHDIDRKVAIKALKPDMRATGHVIRFVDEVRTVGSLEHPNIVPIHDVGIDAAGQFFFVMKYVAGDTLEAIIQKLAAGDAKMHKRFPFTARVQVFQQVLQAVQYAHAQGIVHRDLKPANIMLGEFGEVMVMDWGLAKRVAQVESASTEDPALDEGSEGNPSAAEVRARLFRTRHGTLLGTPAYMSPEQARAQEVDLRSDLYSLGVLFNELLTLEHYLHDKHTLGAMLAGIQSTEIDAYRMQHDPYAGNVPHGLTFFVSKATQKDPSARFQSADEMAAALDEYLTGDIKVTCHVTALHRGASVGKRFVENAPHVAYLGIVSVLGLAGFGVFSLVSRFLH